MEPDPYDLVEQSPGPKPVPMPVAQPAKNISAKSQANGTPTGEGTVSGNSDTTAPQHLAYPDRPRRMMMEVDPIDEYSPLRDRYAPATLLLAGIALRLAQLHWDNGPGASLGFILLLMFLQTILSVILMLVGVFLAAHILSVNFGAVTSAVLKLAAMSIFAWSAGTLAIVLSQYSMPGLIVAIHLVAMIYAVLFYTLFRIDIQEVALTVAIIGVLQFACACFFFQGRHLA